jgi:heme-degrading monooxygenase HmoA
MTTRFKLPASTDWKALRATILERAKLYERMPGLRSKAFVVDEAAGEYGANYLWESRAVAEAFVSSETFRGAIARFGTPDVRIHEVVAYVEGGR